MIEEPSNYVFVIFMILDRMRHIMLEVLSTHRAKSAQSNRIAMAGCTTVVRAARPAVLTDLNLAEMELFGPISVVYIVCS